MPLRGNPCNVVHNLNNVNKRINEKFILQVINTVDGNLALIYTQSKQPVQ